jgi:hypothetical protein
MLDMADDQPFLMSVVIDDTPGAAARVPDGFRERQWTRLPGGTAAAGIAERLMRLLSPAEQTRRTAECSRVRLMRATQRTHSARNPAVPKCPGSQYCGSRRRVSASEFAAFADGLGEDITTGMSRFAHFFVISRNSAMQCAARA